MAVKCGNHVNYNSVTCDIFMRLLEYGPRHGPKHTVVINKVSVNSNI
jgi:hypothetical protein